MDRVKPTEPGQSAVQQPVYKRWWFVLLIAVIILAILWYRAIDVNT